MGKVKIDPATGQVTVITGKSVDVDPNLRYLLKRGYAPKGSLSAVLQVPEVKNKLLELTVKGVIVDAKTVHDAVKPVYDICAINKAEAAARGYPMCSVRNCYNNLSKLLNPAKVVSAGPIGAAHPKFSPVSKKATHRKVAVAKARGSKIK